MLTILRNERSRWLEYAPKLGRCHVIGFNGRNTDAPGGIWGSIAEQLGKAGQVGSRFPGDVLGRPMTSQEFLIHLYGHFNWHLGQIDTLRRILCAAPPGA